MSQEKAEATANTDRFAATPTVISTPAETLASSFGSTDTTTYHETIAASVKSASESSTDATDYHSHLVCGDCQNSYKDAVGPTCPAKTANPIHTDMKRTTTAEATTITERSNAGETTANGKMDEATRVVAQAAETV